LKWEEYGEVYDNLKEWVEYRVDSEVIIVEWRRRIVRRLSVGG
jgi:hypothetical protein